MALVDEYIFWALVWRSIIKITKILYIIGNAIQLYFILYITHNAHAINTDVVDYISTPPPSHLN